MSTSDPRALLADIVGQRCERATNPYGSILSLDFGVLGKREGDDSSSLSHGWRHLTVLSPWRLQDDKGIRCDWNCDGGAGGQITAEISRLTGQVVVSAVTTLPAWDMVMRFSSGVELVVFGDSNDDREDAWFILGTDGTECGASPRVHEIDDDR
jgi:hypothetical protein